MVEVPASLLSLGSLRVVLDGTCSGAWPFIVPEGSETDEAIAELPCVYVADSSACVPFNESPVGWVRKDEHDEVMAYARVFAAAPDLLDALEGMMEAFHFLPCSPADLCPEEWEAATLAVAKATGRNVE